MNSTTNQTVYVEAAPTTQEILQSISYPNLQQFPYVKPSQRNLVVDAPASIPKRISHQRQMTIKNTLIESSRSDILRNIAENKVTMIIGTAGIGKTTQVPQFIMDDCYETMQMCKVMVIEPTDVETLHAARKVAHERNEDLGTTIGYTIELDLVCGITSSIVYCSAGTFLKNLYLPEGLQNVTHLIVDEVHRRQRHVDLILTYLKLVMHEYEHLKVVLLSSSSSSSATDEHLCDYFGGDSIKCGRVIISSAISSGNASPAAGAVMYLEDVLHGLGYCSQEMLQVQQRQMQSSVAYCNNSSDVMADRALIEYQTYCEHYDYLVHYESATAELQLLFVQHGVSVDYQHSLSGVTALMLAASQDDLAFIERLFLMGCNPYLLCHEKKSALEYANSKDTYNYIQKLMNILPPLWYQPSQDNNNEQPLQRLLRIYENSIMDLLVDYKLIGALIDFLCQRFREGVVLVFLPGFEDIMVLKELIEASNIPQCVYDIRILHQNSNIRHDINGLEAAYTAVGKMKIILSTDLAESGINFEQVSFVIDTGKYRDTVYDEYNETSQPITQWISQDMADARSQRVLNDIGGNNAASVMGICFRLYSRVRFNMMMRPIRRPEVDWVPLQLMCLQAKMLLPDMPIVDILSAMPTPPRRRVVDQTITKLQSLCALGGRTESVTPLGDYIALLAIEPTIAKMIMLGTLMGCLDPVLTVAACMANKLLLVPHAQTGLRTEAAQSRQNLLREKCSWTDSDTSLPSTVSSSSMMMACPSSMHLNEHMVYLLLFRKWQDKSCLDKEALDNFAKEYHVANASMNLILETRAHYLGLLRSIGYVYQNNAIHSYNRNSDCWPLIKAVLFTGLYPNFACSVSTTSSNAAADRPQLITKHSINNLIDASSGHPTGFPVPTGGDSSSSSIWIMYDGILRKKNNVGVLLGATAITPLMVILMSSFSSCNNSSAVQQSSTLSTTRNSGIVLDNWLQVHLLDGDSHNTATAPSSSSSFRDDDFGASINNDECVASIMNFKNHLSNCLKRAIKRSSYSTETHFLHAIETLKLILMGEEFRARLVVSPTEEIGIKPRFFQPLAAVNAPSVRNEITIEPFTTRSRNNGAPPTPIRGSNYNSLQQRARYQTTQQISSTTPLRAPMPRGRFDNIAEDTVYILITPKELENVIIGRLTSRWTFAAPTEKKVLHYARQEKRIFLVFHVRRSRDFHGIAKYLDLVVPQAGKPQAYLQWLFKFELDFDKVRHLSNPMNANRALYEGGDGQIIAKSVGDEMRRIYREMAISRHSNSNK